MQSNVLLGFVSGVLITILGAWIKSLFDSRLEKTKNLLLKKYEVYTNVYEAFRKAEGITLQRRYYYPDIRSFNSEDLKKHLETTSASQKEAMKILESFENSQKNGANKMLEANKMLKDILERDRLRKMENQIIEAKNILYLSQIYLSDVVFSKCDELQRKMFAVHAHRENWDVESRSEVNQLEEEIKEGMRDLIKTMKKELR